MNDLPEPRTSASLSDTPNPWTPATPLGERGQAVSSTDTPNYHYALQRTHGVVRGTTSRMRDGMIRLSREGIQISGRAVLKQEMQVLILVGGLLVGIGVLLVALFLEYYRQPREEYISWEEVEEIVLESEKKKICFVYPDIDKPSRSCSLVLHYKDERIYNNIVQAARYFAPHKVHEGKIKRPDIIALWVILGLLICLLIFGIIMSSQK
jgi:hypothetical protein